MSLVWCMFLISMVRLVSVGCGMRSVCAFVFCRILSDVWIFLSVVLLVFSIVFKASRIWVGLWLNIRWVFCVCSIISTTLWAMMLCSSRAIRWCFLLVVVRFSASVRSLCEWVTWFVSHGASVMSLVENRKFEGSMWLVSMMVDHRFVIFAVSLIRVSCSGAYTLSE